MRHDPAAAAIVIMLRSLKMYGMAQAVEDLIEQGAPAFEAAIPILSQLLKAELAEREVRSCRVALKGALPQSVWRRGSILALNSSGPARPYMARLRVFRRLI